MKAYAQTALAGIGILLASVPVLAQQAAGPETSGLQLAAAVEQSLEQAIARAEKSVVAIVRIRKPRDSEHAGLSDQRLNLFGVESTLPAADPSHPDFVPTDYGTGVVIDEAGHILTNYHVLGQDVEDIQNSDYFVTGVDRKVRTARVKAADDRSDLAVLKVDASDLTPIKLGEGGMLRKGQIVIALGNPYAIARDGQVSASWGIVSNLQRKAGPTPSESQQSGKTTLHHLGTLIQTDAKLNLGTSGGALLNLRGEMVGLTTSLAAVAGYEQAAGYAIPVDETFRRVLEELRQGREVQYGFLGVQPNLLSDLGPTQGVLVQSVIDGAPADQAGVEAGDLITHVNGVEIHDFDRLVLQVSSQGVDETVDLVVERNGRRLPVKTRLAKFRPQGRAVVTEREPSSRGLRVEFWTALLEFRPDRDRYQNVDTDGCVVVTEVAPDSAAERAGLKPKMAITHVDGARVTTPKEFHAAVGDAVGDAVGLVTVRIADPVLEEPTEFVLEAE